jgi:hypothetical protein
MKPEAPLSNIGPEQQPSKQGSGVEKAEVPTIPESGVEKSAESFEKRSERGAAVSDISSGLTTVIPTPVSSGKTVADDNSVTIGDPNPLVANDDDLIEKEWVDRAKKIVAETRDDPYQRDEKVNKLQVDYLKKRFGRELGGSE